MVILGIIVSYIVSAICVGMGLHKMFNYNSGELFGDAVNAYVGGDAYNYIINSNYATGYFVLAVLFAIIGMTLVIVNIHNKKRED